MLAPPATMAPSRPATIISNFFIATTPTFCIPAKAAQRTPLVPLTLPSAASGVNLSAGHMTALLGAN